MRLINVETLGLEEFHTNIPPYVILSHTWADNNEELTFSHVKNGKVDKHGVGSVKLRGCCEQAKKDGLGYAWIDTCCIDKTNSVELSEAINSMFRWYRRAQICYTYLSDVPSNDEPWKSGSKFQSSRWFMRGWTLQELLAPSSLRFYNSDWRSLGTKVELCAVIEKITNIPRYFLLGIAELQEASVAQRMSWAAKRDTKREEDLAYCLLGIFGVTMPMIYGEGSEEAFSRLQEQIMRTTRDDSIFAWRLALEGPSSNPTEITLGKVLAAAPSDFANCGCIVPREQFATNSPFISGGSLRIYLSLLSSASGTIGLLSCGPEYDREQVVGIPLTNTTSDEYFRPRGWHSVLLPRPAPSPPGLVYIENSLRQWTPTSIFWFSINGYTETNLELTDVEPRSCWDGDNVLIKSTIKSDRDAVQYAFVRLHYVEGSKDFLIALEVKRQGSHLEAQPHFMTFHKDIRLKKVAELFPYLAQRVYGKRYASSGMLNLHLKWRSIAGKPMSVITLEVTSNTPEHTVDISLELQKLDLQMEFIRMLEERQIGVEEKGRASSIEKESDRLEQIKPRKREMLDDKRAEFKQRWGRVWLIEYGDVLPELDGMDSLSSLLPWVCEIGQEAVAKLLLDKGAAIEAKDKDGGTPLYIASRYGHEAVAKLLLDNGATIEAKDKDGGTPLYIASRNGHEAVTKLLLDNGAAIEAKNQDGETPLYMASFNGHEAVAKLLLDNGAAIESKS